MRAVRPTGQEYLALVTELLQRRRLADPVAGLWEAADVQWWYTRDPHPYNADAVVWVDGDAPVTAAVFTRWSAGRYGCTSSATRLSPPHGISSTTAAPSSLLHRSRWRST